MNFNGASSSINKDSISAYKLSIAILIKEFWRTRQSARYLALEAIKKKLYVRDFCLLLIKLIQSPDLECPELLILLSNAELDDALLEEFESTLELILTSPVGFLLDTINIIKTLTVQEDNTSSSIFVSKHSIAGFYIRRLVISFDKLGFAEVTSFYESFKEYIKKTKDDSKKHNDWLTDHKHWSQRQAELFLVTQATLISNNEQKALNPRSLHKNIQDLLKSNPNLSETHYLSYLNYLRVNEFCGAMDSLYHSFDKMVLKDKDMKAREDKTKVYRYAALNLAVLQYHFGHKEEALIALKEAIRLAQEDSDDVCLQHALAWLYCLTYNRKFIKHSIIKSFDFNLSYISSLGIQSLVQFNGINGGDPKTLCTITKSDLINCKHGFEDLVSTSYAQKSSLWTFYGKSHMSSLWSQLYLNLNTDNHPITKIHMGEGYCQALCNIANQLVLEGEYESANAILSVAREKFPNEPNSHYWMLCECYLEYTLNLHLQNFIETEIAAQKMSVFDQYESKLCMVELLIQKENYFEAKKLLQTIMEKFDKQDSDASIEYNVRARILYAQLEIVCNFPSSIPDTILTELNYALDKANGCHLQYLKAIIHLHIAHTQLLMCMPQHALQLLNTCLLQILSNGYVYDRARALLLYSKCLVANCENKSENERKNIFVECSKMLEIVKGNFKKVQAFHRIKDVLYLQARLYDELDSISERNKCAVEYNILDEEHSSKCNYSLLTYL